MLITRTNYKRSIYRLKHEIYSSYLGVEYPHVIHNSPSSSYIQHGITTSMTERNIISDEYEAADHLLDEHEGAYQHHQEHEEPIIITMSMKEPIITMMNMKESTTTSEHDGVYIITMNMKDEKHTHNRQSPSHTQGFIIYTHHPLQHCID